MLLGRYPHNTGYLMNDDFQSVKSFYAKHNDTVGKWLQDAGYRTAFLGKYVNSCEEQPPSGWNHWGGFINTYCFYNSSSWNVEDGVIGENRVMTGVHQADFLANFTMEQVEAAKAENKPFFISVTPVMPHWGTCYGPGPASVYAPTDPHWEFTLTDPSSGKTHPFPTSPCPTVRHAHAFDGHSNPRLPEVWNKSIEGPKPAWMGQHFETPAGLSAWEVERQDIGWRNRTASLLDLDHLIGEIIGGLDRAGVLDETYVFCTSDNGYHVRCRLDPSYHYYFWVERAGPGERMPCWSKLSKRERGGGVGGGVGGTGREGD